MRIKNKFTDWLLNNFYKLFWPIFLAIILLCVFFCNGCCHPKTIAKSDTVYVTKTDIQYRDRVDSIYTDRWHTIEVKGDTIFVHDSIYYGGWHYKTDTITKTDTIYNTKTEYKEVEKKAPTWPFYLVIAGALLLAFWSIFGHKKRK